MFNSVFPTRRSTGNKFEVVFRGRVVKREGDYSRALRFANRNGLIGSGGFVRPAA